MDLSNIGYQKIYYTDKEGRVFNGIATFKVSDVENTPVLNKYLATYFCSSVVTVKIEPLIADESFKIEIGTSYSGNVFSVGSETVGRIRFFSTKERAIHDYPYPVGFTGKYMEWFPDGKVRVETSLMNGCREGEHKVRDSITYAPTSTFYSKGCLIKPTI